MLNPEIIMSKCEQLLAKTETEKHDDEEEEWEDAEEDWSSDDATPLDPIPILPLPEERKSMVPALHPTENVSWVCTCGTFNGTYKARNIDLSRTLSLTHV